MLDAAPLLAGPLPRWPLALLSALAFAAAGLRLARSNLPSYTTLPLLIPAATLLNPASDPVRDWVLVMGALGGVVAITLTQCEVRNTLYASRLTLYAPRLYPLSLALITATLYLRTLAPTVGEADTFEFQVNAIRLGISHGSGYPLYLLLAELFSLLPVGGTAAFRINLSSAAFGVTAALVTYALARTLDASRPASWIAGLSLATSIGLWSRAVEAEVYTLHVTLVGVLLLIALRSQESEFRIQNVYLLAFVFGLSLTNHLTTALLVPAVAISLAASVIRRPSPVVRHHTDHWLLTAGRWLLAAGFFFLLGLSVYLYLPIRWPAVNNGEMMTWEMFKRFATGQEAQGALRLNAWYTDFSRYAIVGRKALDQFGWPGAITAVIGLIALFRKRSVFAFVTLAAYAAYAFFGLSFYVPDPDYSSFLLPAHLVQGVWIGIGITALLNSEYSILKTHRFSVLSIGYCVFFFSFASLIWKNLPKVDQSTDWREYRLGQYILSQPLKEGAAILADSELIAPLYYLQVAEGIRPDLDIIVLPNEETYRAELDARVSSGQTVYLGRYLPHLADVYHLNSIGPLVEAQFPPAIINGITRYHMGQLGDSIWLKDYKITSTAVSIDESLQVTLYWQAIQSPPDNYLVVLRLVDSADNPVLTGPAEVPVGQMYPTAAWLWRATIADFHNFALDPTLEPGRYLLQVGMFPPFSSDGLETELGGTWLTLTDVTLTPPTTEPAISHPVRMRFGRDVWLMGYDMPTTAAPGSQVTATLYWLSTRTGAAQVCADENCVPVKVRAGNQVTETRVTFPAPNEAGVLRLRVSVPADFAECGWWPAPPVYWSPWGGYHPPHQGFYLSWGIGIPVVSGFFFGAAA